MADRDSRLSGPGPEQVGIRFGITYGDHAYGAPDRPTQQINRVRLPDTADVARVIDDTAYGERYSTDGNSDRHMHPTGEMEYTPAPGRSSKFNNDSYGPFVGAGGPRGF